jgi:peptidoglycan/xylan/chitin deacetylase (PgdA/CDA1 family)
MLRTNITPQEIDHFLKIAEKHHAHVMLAAIPNRLRQSPNAGGKMAAQLRDYAKRGHQIVQHGFDHRCPFTGVSDREFYTTGPQQCTREYMISKIVEGKRLLEDATGKSVTTYVGAGSDNRYVLERDENALGNIGFTWLTDPSATRPYLKRNRGYSMGLEEYSWALTKETYRASMDKAKAAFLKAIARENVWGLVLHDHFTRKAYNGGITLRWFDELLTWLEAQPGLKIRYATLDEWYKEHAKR